MGKLPLFWWALLAVSVAVIVASLWLIWFEDAGNWLTVLSAACTIVVCVISLRIIQRERN